MWLTIVLERHLLPGSNLKIRFNAPSLGFSFQQWECTTSRQEFLWKSFHLVRIKFLPRMLSRFCFPAGFSPGSWRRVFFLGGNFSRENGPSRRDPSEPRESWRDPGEIPVPILQGKQAEQSTTHKKKSMSITYLKSCGLLQLVCNLQQSNTVKPELENAVM